MQVAYDYLHSDNIKNFSGIGLIGGELFNKPLKSDEYELFSSIVDRCLGLLKKNTIERFQIATNLIYEDRSLLLEVLNKIKSQDLMNRFILCTS